MLGRLGPFHVVPGQTISTYSSPVWNFIGNPWEFPKKKTWFNIKLSMIFPSAQHGHVFGSHFLRPWPSSVNCGSVWSWPSAKPALHAKMSTGLLGKLGKHLGKHLALHQWHQSLGKKHGDGSYRFLLVPVRLNFVEQTQLQKNPPRTSICWLFKQGQPPINNGKQW